MKLAIIRPIKTYNWVYVSYIFCDIFNDLDSSSGKLWNLEMLSLVSVKHLNLSKEWNKINGNLKGNFIYTCSDILWF